MKGGQKHPAEHKGGGHKKAKPHEEGLKVDAPLWMMSWADMVTLLMALFVAMYSMSTLDIVKFQRFLEGIKGIPFDKEADGPNAMKAMQDGLKPQIPAEEAMPKGRGKDPGDTDTKPLMPGTYARSDKVRTGKHATATIVLFAPGSATLTAAARERLREAAAELGGYACRIEIRGHCSAGESEDARNLSYARASAAYAFLTAQGGLHDDRIKITAMGTTDRVNQDLSEFEKKDNRRVEVWESEEFPKEAGLRP